jgi:CheY-like chemotaxis protein
MTRVLVVDDDPNQVRALARVISVRSPGLSIVTANGGNAAIDVLRSMPVDVVLTDLQMPDVNGFELLAWLLSHQPHVHVFTMTAYPDDEAMDRVRELGSVECYTKPLDVASVLEKLSSALAQGMRGHVRNIALASLLQLIEMERKTCTLAVESSSRTGFLYIAEGQLIDARWGDMQGDEAAIQMAGWVSPAVTIINTCATKQRTVRHPISYIVMEAMRLHDESRRPAAVARPPSSAGAGLSISVSAPERAEWALFESSSPTPSTDRTLSNFPLTIPANADAIAIVEADSGRIRTSAGRFERLDALAQLVANVYSKEAEAISQLALEEKIEELVITTRRYWTVARPLAMEPPSLAFLVFDPQRANSVLERMELETFVRSMQAWSKDDFS